MSVLFNQFPRAEMLRAPVGAEAASWRDQAWSDFLSRGLPTTRDESWHYTDLSRLLRRAPVDYLVTETILPRQLPEGARMAPMAEALHRGVPGFTGSELLDLIRRRAERLADAQGSAMNLQSGLVQDGWVMVIEPEVVISEPLRLKHVWADATKSQLAVNTLLVMVGAGAKVALVDEQTVGRDVLAMNWLHIEVGAAAKVQVAVSSSTPAEGTSLGLTSIAQQRDSTVAGVLLADGAGLSRATWVIDQLGPDATTHLSALLLGRDRGHVDLRSVICHESPRGTSAQRARALVSGRGRTVFNGKITIVKDAQEVNSSQFSQSLVLSEGAEADAKPELEIYADNVKAAHGASVGRLDEEQMFYFQSRGIRRAEAERLLSEGFAADTLAPLEDAAVKEHFAGWLKTTMAQVIADRGAR